MNRNTIRILASVTIGLVLVLMMLQISERRGSNQTGRLLLPDLEAVANDVNSVEIYRPDGGDSVTIRRKDEKWIVSAHDDYPADVSKLGRLIVQLADAEILEEKTSNPEHYEKLAVDDPQTGGKGTKVVVKGKEFAYAVILGNTAQGRNRYARIAEEEPSYLVNQSAELPTDAGDWLAPNIIDISADKVKKVVISHADGETIVIEKADQEQTNFDVSGVPNGRELAQATVGNNIAGALDKLKLEDVRPASGTRADTTTVYETWDGLQVTAEVAVGEDDFSWITFSAQPTNDASSASDQIAEINQRASGWQYRLANYKESLLTRRWADILK
jgi:hypothetical protein